MTARFVVPAPTGGFTRMLMSTLSPGLRMPGSKESFVNVPVVQVSAARAPDVYGIHLS